MNIDNIQHERIAEYFGGRVLIDELKTFEDPRGFVSEVWRADDYTTNMNPSITACPQPLSYGPVAPKMCYFSHTEPLIMRGPHEHKKQTDWFITIKSKMLYMLVDEEGTVAHFVTDPDRMYRIKVEPGIIHSYRNLSITDVAVTANFPSSLFMGYDKKEEIDEIRHEPKLEENQNIYVLGAGGRLGKALTDELLENMGVHEYNVIPIYDKFDNTETGMRRLNDFLDTILDEDIRTSNDIVVNCIAKTNVQSDQDNFSFSNFQLAKYLTEFSVRHKFHIVNFSTDYIYQTGQVSEYTKSKKQYEQWLESFYSETNLVNNNILSMQKYVHVIRLANLFSQSEEDSHNALFKLWNAREHGSVCVPENLVIMPTDVKRVAEFLAENYLFNIEDYEQFINVSGKPHSVEYIFEEFFKAEAEFDYVENPRAVNNPQAFYNRRCFYEVNCDDLIASKVKSIQDGYARPI